MIDTKIACQCGTRFKFGFELAGGRAPIGLACPSCSAPVTPACDALVDYLSGKEPPAPGGDATRAVKEIKVTCACGARYKFDLELAEKDLPAATVCPQCQADLTAPANELLKAYFATQSAALKEMLAAAPVASVPAPAPDKPAEAAAAPAAAFRKDLLNTRDNSRVIIYARILGR